MPKASLKAAEKYFVVAKPVFVAMSPTERSVSHSRGHVAQRHLPLQVLCRIPTLLMPVGEGDLEKRLVGEAYDGAVGGDTLVGGSA